MISRVSVFRNVKLSTIGLAFVVVLLGICVWLAATNPTTDDYGVFLEGMLGQALDRMQQQGTPREHAEIRDLLRSQGKHIIKSVVRPNTVRHNYGLFSVFKTRVLDFRLEVVGIGNHFFPGEDVEEISRKFGQLMLAPGR